MTFAEDLLDKLFPSAQPANQPLVQEPLRRTRRDRMSYRKWKKSNWHRELSLVFGMACFLKKRSIRCSVNVHLFDSRAANAFSISCSDFIDHKSFQHYFDYVRERLLGMGYLPFRSDCEMLDRVLYVETVERHFFKLPHVLDEQGRRTQLYGNVFVELIRVNDRPSYLKLTATYQNKTGYAPAASFDELMRRIFV